MKNIAFILPLALATIVLGSFPACAPSSVPSQADAKGLNTRLVRIDGTVKDESGERLKRFTLKVHKEGDPGEQTISTDIRGSFSVTLRLARTATIYFADAQGREVKWLYDSAGAEPSINIVSGKDTLTIR